MINTAFGVGFARFGREDGPDIRRIDECLAVHAHVIGSERPEDLPDGEQFLAAVRVGHEDGIFGGQLRPPCGIPYQGQQLPPRGLGSAGDLLISMVDRFDTAVQIAPFAAFQQHGIRREHARNNLGFVDPLEIQAVDVAVADF